MTLADVVLAKKWELDALRHALPPDALAGLEHNQRIGVTYATNALDGNVLTAGETALIIENGMTFSGKPLKDHLEVAEHAKALEWVIDAATADQPSFGEVDLRRLHRLVVGQSIPEISGRYADRERRIETAAGVFVLPEPAAIPELAARFCDWLASAPSEPASAFEAHFRLMAIHPFNDGNGRTARLVTNLLLARSGFPIIAVRPEDRSEYYEAIGVGLAGGDSSALGDFLFQRLDRTLDTFLAAARQAQGNPADAQSTRT